MPGASAWKAEHRHRRTGDHPPRLRPASAAARCELACASGRKRLTIVHKANILPLTDGLFRDTVLAGGSRPGCRPGYGVEVDELLVDIAATQAGQPSPSAST